MYRVTATWVRPTSWSISARMATRRILLAIAFMVATAAGSSIDILPASKQVHIALLTDCTMYSDWQSVAAEFSHRRSLQPGKLTRVMCCTDEQKARYDQELLSLVETHVAPSFAYNPRTKDNYAAYNKPGAVVDWLAHVEPVEDWILLLDSDMLMRRPIHPQFYNAVKGWCISADYTYMIGVANALADRHIPEIAKRTDSFAGPVGRRADMVGGFFFQHRDDLKRVAPLWLNYTEDVREDPEAWHLSGDSYVEKGGKPWISEMYGYAFAAAKSNVWHKWDKRTMIYPNYEARGRQWCATCVGSFGLFQGYLGVGRGAIFAKSPPPAS